MLQRVISGMSEPQNATLGGHADDTTVATLSHPGAHLIQMNLDLVFENNYFSKMCSGSEAGSYSGLTDFVYHSTLGLGVKKNRERKSRRFSGPTSI